VASAPGVSGGRRLRLRACSGAGCGRQAVASHSAREMRSAGGVASRRMERSHARMCGSCSGWPCRGGVGVGILTPLFFLLWVALRGSVGVGILKPFALTPSPTSDEGEHPDTGVAPWVKPGGRGDGVAREEG
jgi:hypothetical protein